MNRRGWLQWGCAHCALLAGVGQAQNRGDDARFGRTPEPPPDGSVDPATWRMPARFARPEVSTDEGGLWALMDREETRLRRSPFRMRDDALGPYLGQICSKLAGEHAADLRVYAVRTAHFNASMAPNGMMQVWSGLLLRMDNEAQLAAVIGHEIGHYLQRHSLERLRDIKQRSAFAAVMGLFGVVGAIGQLATLAGAFGFSREHERQADIIGSVLMRQAGYDPREAARVWGNLLLELKANPDTDPTRQSVLFATHPPSQEREDHLRQLSAGSSGQTFDAEYRRMLAPYRFDLLNDELKRARPAETLVLLQRMLAAEPASAQLLYFRGEVRRVRNGDGDRALALADLEAAVAAGREPAETHRALGYLHLADHRADAARQAWQRYLHLLPQAADAAYIQQALKELPT